MCELILGRMRAARFSFSRLMEFQPTEPFAYSCIALTYFLTGKKDAAVAFLDDILGTGLVTEPALMVRTRAMLEERMGLKDEAFIHYLETFMLLKGNDPGVGLKLRELSEKKEEE